MNFFSSDLRPATKEQCSASWSGSKGGLRFRCKMCGKRFKPGDMFRVVYANSADSPTRTGNFMVCETCNDTNENLLKRMAEIEEEGYRRFWWLVDDDRTLARWTTSGG